MNDSGEKGAESADSPARSDFSAILETLEAQADVEREQARQAEFANRALEAQFHLGVRRGILRATRLLRQLADA